ncbi:class I SAM-dependent DNA methyltransferase [Rhodococcus rhodochrous]|uniref:site-specific DNA-methyltransferase (adenine-specific) n=1 Tax=Rhodococcus rhodochrous J45 TaxID=935266 RepID=A0A562DK38_RHORH|nr:DNA methyltransferase [Rhodococcus rhodochrous]TWH09971.1 type II restriction/modification system DNA methylase subunit YeeA [Rhodococcus rhodochrous J45]
MTDNRLLDLVDDRDFRVLFVEELGWNNPDRPDLTVEVDDETFTLQQVAGYKGLRIWHCPVLPPRKIQRQIDVLVGQDNQERLVIFTNEQRQEWRWPRRAQLGSANAKLLVHQHIVGDRSTHLTGRLQAIELDFDEDLSLVALLDKMRDAFDHEAETASVAAARLMGALYTELETCGVGEHDATLLLARLLFLLFGDDADMWKPQGLFEKYLREHTTAETLHSDLLGLFEVLDTEEKNRTLTSDSPYDPFRYINGGLFRDSLRLPPLNTGFRDALIEACEFDWSIISPAVFGSMFQTVKSKESRRRGGEHYTTEENILKTIRPLFLNEYRDKLERSWDDKAQLTKLHNELGRLRFLDPACGCGNFLVVAYRELRALELDILKRRRDLDMTDVASKKVKRAQLSLDVSGDIKVTLDHFYGIEIEEWPARIAETAMLLVDHLANQQMAVEFGVAPDRLPIVIAPKVIHGNALREDWRAVLPPSENVFILGNPPFIGERWRAKELSDELKSIWGQRMNAQFDYVTAWYKKTVDYFGETPGSWAFVSTSSIVQGEPVAPLFSYIQENGWRIKFAYKNFPWSSETLDHASVHCVIIGFTKNKVENRMLFAYTGGRSYSESYCKSINAYLIDGPEVLVTKRSKPIASGLTQLRKGSYPTDGGFLTIGPEEIDQFLEDPVTKKYVRRFVGSRELLNGQQRWCLWLKEYDPVDASRSELLRARLEGVRISRLASSKVATQKKAQTPHLFDEDRQPDTPYLAIPVHSSSARKFLPCEYFSPEVICYAANFIAPDPEGFLFGIISSSMFITWMRTVGGRIKSDLRLSNTLTYNTFPLPSVKAEEKARIIEAGRGIISTRGNYPGWSLAKMYDPSGMPEDLTEAHRTLDSEIDSLFGKGDFSTETGRQTILFHHYAKLTGQDDLL